MISPRAADAIRKVLGYALATAITLLLFRVLGRAAGGRQSLADLELLALVVLAAAAVAWVAAAKRVRRRDLRDGPPPGPDARRQ